MAAKFYKGERVLGPQKSRALALFDIEEIYLDHQGKAVYKARRCSTNSPELVEEIQLEKVPGRFVIYGGGVWDIKFVHQAILTVPPGEISEVQTAVLEKIVEHLNQAEVRGEINVG